MMGTIGYDWSKIEIDYLFVTWDPESLGNGELRKT
jgi:hypothetical protein